MAAMRAVAWVGLWGWLAWALAASAMAAVPEDCVERGGQALCVRPVPVPSSLYDRVDDDGWAYNQCDYAASSSARTSTWCAVQGGTWDAQHIACLGARPTFDGDIAANGRAFEAAIHAACQTNLAGDTGWGQTIHAGGVCWEGAPETRYGILVRDYRRLEFQGLAPQAVGGACTQPWAETQYALRSRGVGCPVGYALRETAPDAAECWKLDTCCADVANGVDPASGAVRWSETDFRAGTPGGVDLVRHYDSQGYFGVDGTAPHAGDHWRTNWDKRVIARPAGGAVTGYAVRPDGRVLAFGGNGRSLHNVDGGGDITLQRSADASGGTTGYTVTTADRDVESYDAAGRLTAVVTRAGARYAITRDAASQTIRDAFGRSLVLAYDGRGRLVSAALPGNRTIRYGYDSAGRLATVTQADGARRTYAYDSAVGPHALAGVTDEAGRAIANWSYWTTSDGGGVPGRARTSVRGGVAESTTLFYQGLGLAQNVFVLDALGLTRTQAHAFTGGARRMASITAPCGTPQCSTPYVSQALSESTFDANGNVASRTDFEGHKTCAVWNLVRNLELVRTEGLATADDCAAAAVPDRPDARRTTFEWHPVYRLPVRIWEPSRMTEFVYNGDVVGGQALTCAPSAGGFPAPGLLCRRSIRETADANGAAGAAAALQGTAREWTFSWDALGRRLSERDPRGNTTTYAYYADDDPDLRRRGALRLTVNAAGHRTTYDAYDDDGFATATTDPNGRASVVERNARGWMVARTDAGLRTAYDYDAAGLLVRATLPDGSTLAYDYDAAQRLVGIRDGFGHRIAYTLDGLGNRIREDAYDGAGNLATSRGRVYDSLNRLHQHVGAR